MSLAAHLPQPAVYVLDHETSLNAFAAGRRADDAAIGITAGALAAFDREELQALIGHELSHLLNGDTALNTRLVAWLHGLHAPTMLAKGMLRGEKSRFDPRALVAWPLIVGLYLVGAVGTLLGLALQAMISRRRESLADAAAVQFTRNPQALRAVLLKIAGSSAAAPLDARDATAAAHMMFSSLDLGWLGRVGGPLFATHPPLLERVRALDPTVTEASFNALAREARAEIRARREAAAAARVESVARNAEQSALRRAMQAAAGIAVAGGGVSLSGEPGAAARADAAAQSAAESPDGGAANPQRATPAPASRTTEDDPAPFDALWHRMTRDQQQSVTKLIARHAGDEPGLELLLVAALLPPGDAARAAQLTKFAAVFGGELASRVEPARIDWQSLAPIARMPAILQLLPRIGAADEARRTRWLRVAAAYARLATPADTTTFAITRVLLHRLAPPRPAPAGKHPALVERADAIGLLYSVLAHESGDGALDAYRFGLQDVLPPQRWPTLVRAPFESARVDAAYEALAALHVAARRAVCVGLARIVARNRLLSVGEADWLRATAVLLDVPMPAVRIDVRLDAEAAG